MVLTVTCLRLRKDDIFIKRNISSQRRCSVEKSVLKKYAKFIGKHLCQSLFFNEVAG